MKHFALAAIMAITQAQDKRVADENKGVAVVLPNAVSSGVTAQGAISEARAIYEDGGEIDQILLAVSW